MQYSVVRTADLDKIVFRLDAEFYHPEQLNLQKKLSQFNSISIQNAGGNLDCSAFYPSIVPYYNFDKQGIPFLRVNEIQNGLLNISHDTAFLPQEVLDGNRTTIARCTSGDLIIAKGGNSLAKVALLTEEYPHYSICRDVIVLRTDGLSGINRYYLWMFLHSEIGQKVLLRTASQTGQPHLTLDAIKQIEVPLFANKFQNRFERLYKESQRFKQESEKEYRLAQILLLTEIGLTNWQPKHQLTFIKNYSDTQQAERIDAEYYQPKYDEIIHAIQNYTGGWESLDDLVNLKDQNFNPKSDVEYNYIELSNIAGNGEITGCTTEYGTDLPSRARRKVTENDVIVSSIEGSLSSIALVGNDYNDALCSTGFYVINSDFFNSESLLVLMKSIAGQMLLKKGCNGTILTAINKDEFLNIPLPKLRQEAQQEIQQKVTESFNLRKQSKHLLECAKKAVEMAIEQDEQTAIDWLKAQTQSIGADDASGL
jgi:type I restriction enzyme S subunit